MLVAILDKGKCKKPEYLDGVLVGTLVDLVEQVNPSRVDIELVYFGSDGVKEISLPEEAYKCKGEFLDTLKEYGEFQIEHVNHTVSRLNPIGDYLFKRQEPEHSD